MIITLADRTAVNGSADFASTERLLNCYTHESPADISPIVIRPHMGLRTWAPTQDAFLRASNVVQDKMVSVQGGHLYRFEDRGSYSKLADIPDDEESTVEGHRGWITLSANGSYYVYDNDNGLTEVEGGAFDSVGSVEFLSERTFLTERLGRRVEWTEVGQPDQRNALNFAEAGGRDDRIIRALRHGEYLFILKERSHEIWSVDLTGPGRVPGGVFDVGLKSFRMAANTPVGLFFIGSDGSAYLTVGGEPQRVSTEDINDAIFKGDIGGVFSFSDRGHDFVVIGFRDRPARVFDLTTNRWHERGTGDGSWAVTNAEFVWGQWQLGTEAGNWFRLGLSPNDDGEIMPREITSRPFWNEGGRFRVNRLELVGEFGRLGAEEQENLRIYEQTALRMKGVRRAIMGVNQFEHVSIDGPSYGEFSFSQDGKTWGKPKTRSFGMIGDYRARCVLRRLGQFRKFHMKLRMTGYQPISIGGTASADIR